jgi:hypothetical protein
MSENRISSVINNFNVDLAKLLNSLEEYLDKEFGDGDESVQEKLEVMIGVGESLLWTAASIYDRTQNSPFLAIHELTSALEIMAKEDCDCEECTCSEDCKECDEENKHNIN